MTLLTDLIEVQLGNETTWGTPVTPTVKLMGIEDFTLRPVNEAQQHPEMRGTLQPGYLTNLTRIAGAGGGNGLVLYEDLPYWLDSLFSEATPAGAGPYTYSYTAPLGTATTPREMTVVKGDGSDVYALEGGLVNALTIRGESGNPLRFTVELIGEEVVADTLAALSDRSVNVAMGDQVDLYIDAWGGTIGTTQITSLARLSFELTLQANRELVPTLGQLKPISYHDRKYTGTLRLSLEFDTASQAYLDEIIGGSTVFQRQIRLNPALDANHDITLDFAGSALAAPEIFTNQNGLVTVDLVLEGTYNSQLGNFFASVVTNQVSALP